MSGLRNDDIFVDQVKSAITLSEFIGRTVKLTRSGHDFKGLSPFGREKTPSFYVSDEKRAFYCFSTGKSGDVFTFLMETERLNFREALERAAAHAGLQMPVYNPQQAAIRARRERLYAALGAAAGWFQAALHRDVAGADQARNYLQKRGVTLEVARQWGLGYAPAAGGLISAMAAADIAEVELVEAGIIGKSADGKVYERFRNRLIFPIEDTRSRRVVSFGGRALANDAPAKYLNGSESPIFKKNTVLYGLQRAIALPTTDRRRDHDLVLVEGYFDVIACQAAGVRAVAPLGTAVSEAHIELLWQRCGEPLACLDGDAAGRNAAYRLVDWGLPLLRHGKSLNFCELSGGADPDEVFRTAGAEGLLAALEQIRPLVDLVYEKTAGLIESPTPERIVGLRHSLLEACAPIPLQDLREAYRRTLLARYHVAFGHIDPVEDHIEIPADEPLPAEGNLAAAGKVDLQDGDVGAALGVEPVAASLALAAIDHPGWLCRQRETYETTCFGDKRLSILAGFMRRIIGDDIHPESWLDGRTLREELVANGFDEDIAALARAAVELNAPYLRAENDLILSSEIWSETFIAQERHYALKNLFAGDRGDLIDQLGQTAFYEMRNERDRLNAALTSGYLWDVLIAGIDERADRMGVG